ncbi:hypothetical protein [Clostridioides difficile]|uniref:hypothetical protein n=1 Tax=Clostridioides difficile TaxID=1496 RepID=UPI000BB16B30|nr:hypothetical protein [Clostridioides difficile]PBH86740.1 hypothetical protein BGU52_14540 [Clostridioides difficile]
MSIFVYLPHCSDIVANDPEARVTMSIASTSACMAVVFVFVRVCASMSQCLLVFSHLFIVARRGRHTRRSGTLWAWRRV